MHRANFFTISQPFRLLKPNFRKVLIESYSHKTIGHIYGFVFLEIPILTIFLKVITMLWNFKNCNPIEPLYNSWKFQPNWINSFQDPIYLNIREQNSFDSSSAISSSFTCGPPTMSSENFTDPMQVLLVNLHT